MISNAVIAAGAIVFLIVIGSIVEWPPAGKSIAVQPPVKVVAPPSGPRAATSHLFAGGMRLAQVAGAIAFMHADASRNVVAMSGADGAIASAAEYLPFGLRVATSGTVARGFMGAEEDRTGVLYAGARVLDPKIGRFSSPDPLLVPHESGYTYGLANPLVLADADGRRPEGAQALLRGPAARFHPMLAAAVAPKMASTDSASVAITGMGQFVGAQYPKERARGQSGLGPENFLFKILRAGYSPSVMKEAADYSLEDGHVEVARIFEYLVAVRGWSAYGFVQDSGIGQPIEEKNPLFGEWDIGLLQAFGVLETLDKSEGEWRTVELQHTFRNFNEAFAELTDLAKDRGLVLMAGFGGDDILVFDGKNTYALDPAKGPSTTERPGPLEKFEEKFLIPPTAVIFVPPAQEKK